MSTSRRQFLKSSLMVAGGAALLPITTFAQPNDAVACQGVDLSLLQQAWDKSGMPHPLVYLRNSGLMSLSANIQDASKKDFQAGLMLSVDGLMLSHAESAFLLSASGGFHV